MSAVIYAAIVVMWAVVLVPMWLRRHDAVTETRSVDKFSTAMRTLSRRTTSAPGRRYVVMPRRSQGMSVHVSGAAVAPVAPTPPAPRPAARPASPRPARPPRRRASIVARRRRWLLGLLSVTFLTVVLAAAGALSWPLQLLFDVVLAGFVIHLRKQARRSVAVTVARQRPAPAARPAAPAAPAASRPAAPAPRPAAPVTVPVADAATEPMEPIVEPVLEPVVAATGTDDAAGDTWEPVPVPPPTYVMKPPAPAFEADPTYTDPVYSPAPATAAAEGETDLDDILERRWAVND